MRRVFALAALVSAAALAAERPVVTRPEMATVEQSIDNAVRALNPDDPYDLLGFARGVYLPGYGVVLTAELNLVITPVSPFTPRPAGAQLTQLRLKKIQRLVVIRELMRHALVSAAATLDPVPSNERIVVGLTLFYRNFEEREGLPGQIVMQAPKQVLLDFKANRIGKAQLDAAIEVQEL
ncbi:MAG TPA: hypothetical protein VF767_02970 [Bryobacteraceae bacterium]